MSQLKWELSDKGFASITTTTQGIAYGVVIDQYKDNPMQWTFAQFMYRSDAVKFIQHFNDEVAQRVEPRPSGSGEGFESLPSLPNSPAAPDLLYILDLIERALPFVEEGEQFNKPKQRDLSKLIRAILTKYGR